MEPLTEAEQNRFILEHLSLPKAIAREICQLGRGRPPIHTVFGVELEELIAAGHVGLVEAGREYDPSKGWFPDWASRRIHARIIDFIRRQGWFPDEVEGGDAEFLDGTRIERIYEWQRWGDLSALTEVWQDLDETPEEWRLKWEQIKYKTAAVDAAMLGLTRLQREAITYVFFRGKKIADFAREKRISYQRAARDVHRAINKMRTTVRRIELNKFKKSPPQPNTLPQSTRGRVVRFPDKAKRPLK